MADFRLLKTCLAQLPPANPEGAEKPPVFARVGKIRNAKGFFLLLRNALSKLEVALGERQYGNLRQG